MRKRHHHSGSAIVYLGISMIMFVLVFGFLFQLTPVILGAVFTTMRSTAESMNLDTGWLDTYNEVDALSQYLVTLIMSLGIVVFIIKVIMVAVAHGRG